MMSKLLSSLRSTPRTSVADAQKALDQARAEAAEAQTLLDKARADYDGSLLEDHATTTRARDRITAAEILVHRATALVGLAEQRLAEAQATQAEAARVERYAEAQALTKKAVAELKAYPELAARFHAIIEAVARAGQAVLVVNEDLPQGKAPIVDAEQQVRGLPAEPARIVSETIGDPVWTYAEGNWRGSRVEKHDLNSIKVDADGMHGILDPRHGLTHPNFGDPAYGPVFRVVRRREKLTESIPSKSPYIPTPLAAQVVLPGLKAGAPDLWSPVGGHPSFVLPGTNEREVLASLDAVRELQKAPPVDPRGEQMPDRKRELLEPYTTNEEVLAAHAIPFT